jgi:hypothetical protein
MDGESKARVESALETLKKAVERNDTAEIRTASEALSKIWNEVSSKLYAQAGQGGGHGGPAGEGGAGASGPSDGGSAEGRRRRSGRRRLRSSEVEGASVPQVTLTKKATFGAGCFWGVEAAFRREGGRLDASRLLGGRTPPRPTSRSAPGGQGTPRRSR